MVLNDRRLLSRVFMLLSLGNLISYIFFHISYTLSTYHIIDYEELAIGVETVRTYISEAWEFVLPALGGSAILLSYVFMGLKGAAIYTGVLSLCRIFYCLPYYYIYFISFGYDSVEAILISALVTLGMILLSALIFALTAAAGAIAVKLIRKVPFCELRSELTDGLRERGILELSSSSVALLVMTLTRFAVYFIKGIINTVSFLTEYGASFNPKELFSMIISLLLPVILAALLYLLLSALRIRIAQRRIEDEVEYPEEA